MDYNFLTNSTAAFLTAATLSCMSTKDTGKKYNASDGVNNSRQGISSLKKFINKTYISGLLLESYFQIII